MSIPAKSWFVIPPSPVATRAATPIFSSIDDENGRAGGASSPQDRGVADASQRLLRSDLAEIQGMIRAEIQQLAASLRDSSGESQPQVQDPPSHTSLSFRPPLYLSCTSRPQGELFPPPVSPGSIPHPSQPPGFLFPSRFSPGLSTAQLHVTLPLPSASPTSQNSLFSASPFMFPQSSTTGPPPYPSRPQPSLFGCFHADSSLGSPATGFLGVQGTSSTSSSLTQHTYLPAVQATSATPAWLPAWSHLVPSTSPPVSPAGPGHLHQPPLVPSTSQPVWSSWPAGPGHLHQPHWMEQMFSVASTMLGPRPGGAERGTRFRRERIQFRRERIRMNQWLRRIQRKQLQRYSQTSARFLLKKVRRGRQERPGHPGASSTRQHAGFNSVTSSCALELLHVSSPCEKLADLRSPPGGSKVIEQEPEEVATEDPVLGPDTSRVVSTLHVEGKARWEQVKSILCSFELAGSRVSSDEQAADVSNFGTSEKEMGLDSSTKELMLEQQQSSTSSRGRSVKPLPTFDWLESIVNNRERVPLELYDGTKSRGADFHHDELAIEFCSREGDELCHTTVSPQERSALTSLVKPPPASNASGSLSGQGLAESAVFWPFDPGGFCHPSSVNRWLRRIQPSARFLLKKVSKARQERPGRPGASSTRQHAGCKSGTSSCALELIAARLVGGEFKRARTTVDDHPHTSFIASSVHRKKVSSNVKAGSEGGNRGDGRLNTAAPALSASTAAAAPATKPAPPPPQALGSSLSTVSASTLPNGSVHHPSSTAPAQGSWSKIAGHATMRKSNMALHAAGHQQQPPQQFPSSGIASSLQRESPDRVGLSSPPSQVDKEQPKKKPVWIDEADSSIAELQSLHDPATDWAVFPSERKRRHNLDSEVDDGADAEEEGGTNILRKNEELVVRSRTRFPSDLIKLSWMNDGNAKEPSNAVARFTSLKLLLEAAAGESPSALHAEVQKQFQSSLKQQKMKFLVKTKVVEVEDTGPSLQLLLEVAAGGSPSALDADVVLVAAGRVMCTDALGLEEASIKLNMMGRVEVDDRFKTSLKGVCAKRRLQDPNTRLKLFNKVMAGPESLYEKALDIYKRLQGSTLVMQLSVSTTETDRRRLDVVWQKQVLPRWLLKSFSAMPESMKRDDLGKIEEAVVEYIGGTVNWEAVFWPFDPGGFCHRHHSSCLRKAASTPWCQVSSVSSQGDEHQHLMVLPCGVLWPFDPGGFG